MKKFEVISLLMALSLLCACSSSDDPATTGKPDTPAPVNTKITKESLQGNVEVYPFNYGQYKVTFSDLDSGLALTGRYFSSDATGVPMKYDLISPMVFSSKYTEAAAELNSPDYQKTHDQMPKFFCITTIDSTSKVNVNILTHLEYGRVRALCKNGVPFVDAKKQANKELLKVFGITKEISSPETISVFDNDDNAKVLLAVSCIMLDPQVYHNNEQYTDTSSIRKEYELADKFSKEFSKYGKINDEAILSEIKENEENCHPSEFTEYLEARYESNGAEISLPDFTDYVDFNGDGVIDSNDEEEEEEIDNITPCISLDAIYGMWEAIHAEGYYTSKGEKVTYDEDVNGIDSEYMERLQFNSDGSFIYYYPGNGEWTNEGDYGIFSLNYPDVSLRYHDDDEIEHRTIIMLTSDRLMLSWDNTEGTKHAVYTYKKIESNGGGNNGGGTR